MAARPVALPRVVTPDADEARRWAREELSRSEYETEPGLLERAWRWVVAQLERLLELDAAAPPTLVPLLLVVGVAALLAAALYLAGPVRLRRRAREDSAVVFEDASTSERLHALADEAAAGEDWARAVLLRFRAVIRSLDERAVLQDRPGLTAHEAATTAADRLPDLARELLRAGRLFDDVCYGHARPGRADEAGLRSLAQAVARARPHAPAPAPSATTEAP